MRKYLFIVALCMASSVLCAQFEFGAYVGTTMNKLSGDSPRDFIYVAKLGATFGGIISYSITPDTRVSFQPGYAINRPVAQYRDRELEEVRDTANFNLDYIRLPVYLDIISDNQKWHYIAGVDFQISTGGSVTLTTGEESDLSDELSTLNPVIYFGLGRRIRLGKNILNVDLRFGQGILNLSNRPDDETSYIPRIKTSVAELIVSYEFVNRKIDRG